MLIKRGLIKFDGKPILYLVTRFTSDESTRFTYERLCPISLTCQNEVERREHCVVWLNEIKRTLMGGSVMPRAVTFDMFIDIA